MYMVIYIPDGVCLLYVSGSPNSILYNQLLHPVHTRIMLPYSSTNNFASLSEAEGALTQLLKQYPKLHRSEFEIVEI